MMEQFDAFFEVMTVLNFAFIAQPVVDIFRNFVTSIKYKIDSSKRILFLSDRTTLRSQRLIEPLSGILNKQERALLEEFDKTDNMEKDIQAKREKISFYYQNSFFISGIFCLIYLILVGYEKYITGTHNSITYLFLFELLTFYPIIIFVSSFWQKYYIKTINPIWSIITVAAVIVIITFVRLFVRYEEDNDFLSNINSYFIVTIAILNSLSTFIFFSIRIILHNLRARNTFRNYDNTVITPKLKTVNDLYQAFIEETLEKN